MNEEMLMKLVQMLKEKGQGGGEPSGGQLMQALQSKRQQDNNVSKGRNKPQNRGQSGGMDKQKLMQMMKMLQQG